MVVGVIYFCRGAGRRVGDVGIFHSTHPLSLVLARIVSPGWSLFAIAMPARTLSEIATNRAR
jgi:hypothetical protein